MPILRRYLTVNNPNLLTLNKFVNQICPKERALNKIRLHSTCVNWFKCNTHVYEKGDDWSFLLNVVLQLLPIIDGL